MSAVMLPCDRCGRIAATVVALCAPCAATPTPPLHPNPAELRFAYARLTTTAQDNAGA